MLKRVEKAVYCTSQLRTGDWIVPVTQCKHKSEASNNELLLTHQTGVVFWRGHDSLWCVWCPHRWLPGREGEALRLRPAGSGLGRSFGRLRPLQTSAQAGLTKAPLQPAFMCPLMRKPPAQQPPIKHRQIKTPKYESAMQPNSVSQDRGVVPLY